MKNDLKIKDLFSHYTPKQLVYAFLIDLLFFILTGGIAIILFVNIVFMMVRYFMAMYIILYGFLVLFTYLAKKYFIETLQHYKHIPNMDYTQLRYILVIIYSIVILLIQTFIFIIIT